MTKLVALIYLLQFFVLGYSNNGLTKDNLVVNPSEDFKAIYYVKSFQEEEYSFATCSLNNPCAFATALKKARAGGTIFIRKGHYKLSKPIYITAPSKRHNYLIISSTPHEEVILSGAKLSGKYASGGLINIASQSYLEITDLHLKDYKSRKPNSTIMGIFIKGKARYIKLTNNYISNIKTLTPNKGTSALGIAIYGTHTQSPINKVLVEGNIIHDLTLGFSEALTLAGNIENFVVSNNTLYNLNNIGIDIAGAYGHVCWQLPFHKRCDKDLDYARRGKVVNNFVYNIDTRTNPVYSDDQVNAAAGIYLDGSRQILVANNVVSNSGVGISISSENKGGLASHITLKNNFIDNNWRTGISLGAENAFKGKVKDCFIMGNFFLNNDKSLAWGGELYMEYKVSNCKIYNNTFSAHNIARETASNEIITLNLMINDFLNPLQSGNVNNELRDNIYMGAEIATWFWQGKWYNQNSFGYFCEQAEKTHNNTQTFAAKFTESSTCRH